MYHVQRQVIAVEASEDAATAFGTQIEGEEVLRFHELPQGDCLAGRRRRALFSLTRATHGNTYGPLGITAIVALGPYSARQSATACSTVGAGSTWHCRNVSGVRPSVMTL